MRASGSPSEPPITSTGGRAGAPAPGENTTPATPSAAVVSSRAVTPSASQRRTSSRRTGARPSARTVTSSAKSSKGSPEPEPAGSIAWPFRSAGGGSIDQNRPIPSTPS